MIPLPNYIPPCPIKEGEIKMVKYRIEQEDVNIYHIIEKDENFNYDLYIGTYSSLEKARKELKKIIEKRLNFPVPKIIEKYDKYGNLIED